MKTEEKKREATNKFLIRTIIFVLISLAICCSFFFQEKIENFINYNLNKNALSSEIDENGLKVHFIDVGQGDSCLIEFPTGETMLIDTGKSSENEKLSTYLNSINFGEEDGEKVIDYFILTHPDSDHIGNAVYIFDNYLVKNCYLPQIYYYNISNPSDTPWAIPEGAATCSDDLYKDVVLSLNNEISTSGCLKTFSSEHTVITSQTYSSSDAKTNKDMWILNFFSPIDGKYYEKNGEAETNEYSPIMILNYLGKKIMLTGDGSKDLEEDFLKELSSSGYAFSASYFDVDILKIAHHGSKSSSTEEFLEVVKPEYAIISVGKNSYGHPTEETLIRLQEAGVDEKNIYRTDKNGNILVGISTSGSLSLVANHVQYSVVEIQLWQVVISGIGVVAIIVYSPYLAKFAKTKRKSKK